MKRTLLLLSLVLFGAQNLRPQKRTDFAGLNIEKIKLENPPIPSGGEKFV